jgi:hypothetical protein
MTEIHITFPNKKKFASKHIDQVADQIFKSIDNKSIKFNFDLSTFTWIGPEALTFLTSIFIHLRNKKINFYVTFKATSLPQDMDEDVANNLIYLWERWGIYKAIGDRDIYGKGIYCDINHDYINALKLIFANDNANAKVYNWHSVTKSPFFYFQDDRNLTEFDEENFDAEMDSRVTLTDSGEKLLVENLSQRPFLEKTLS